jgi:hypothetical protein
MKLVDLDKYTDKCCADGCNKTAVNVAQENKTFGEKKIKTLLLCSNCRVAKYCSKVISKVQDPNYQITHIIATTPYNSNNSNFVSLSYVFRIMYYHRSVNWLLGRVDTRKNVKN